MIELKKKKTKEKEAEHMLYFTLAAFVVVVLMALHVCTLYVDSYKIIKEQNETINELQQRLDDVSQLEQKDTAQVHLIHPSESVIDQLGNKSYEIYVCKDCGWNNYDNLPDVVVFRQPDVDILYSDNNFAVLGVCSD